MDPHCVADATLPRAGTHLAVLSFCHHELDMIEGQAHSTRAHRMSKPFPGEDHLIRANTPCWEH